jgi:Domain of unknown function (DUF397)
MMRPSEGPGDDVRWHRSTRCNSGTCAEVAADGADVWVRNSQRPETVATFDAGEWAAFVAGIKDGEFD